jgi:hypothetical protein
VALKNLGAIFGKEEGSLRALYYQATLQRVRSPRPAECIRPRLHLYGSWEIWSRPGSISRRFWRWRHPRSCAAWPGMRSRRLPPESSRPVGHAWMRSSLCCMPCGCFAASRAGDSGNRLTDRHSGQVRAGYQRSPGEPRPASAAGKDFLGAAMVITYHKRSNVGFSQ